MTETAAHPQASSPPTSAPIAQGNAPDAARAQRYWLPSHVRATPTVTGTVMLDLNRNRYFGIDTRATRALYTLDHGWRCSNPRAQNWLEPMTQDEAMQIGDKLVEAGLLGHAAPAEDEFVPAPIDLDGVLTSVGEQVSRRSSLRPTHVINFLRACSWSRKSIRSRTLYAVARELSAGKRDAPNVVDEERIVELVCMFRRLRPFAFTAKDQCLFHALALMKFLAAYELFPTWVIGVRHRPWAAHSWVQAGALLLDSNPEHVCEYSPILTI